MSTARPRDKSTQTTNYRKIKIKLENVAINDVLPLKAARRHAIGNLKCFWASDTKDLILMIIFTFTMRRHLIRLVSVPFISSRNTVGQNPWSWPFDTSIQNTAKSCI